MSFNHHYTNTKPPVYGFRTSLRVLHSVHHKRIRSSPMATRIDGSVITYNAPSTLLSNVAVALLKS